MKVNRIAIVMNGGIGDHIRKVFPLAHALKSLCHCHITLFATRYLNVYEANPDINRIVQSVDFHDSVNVRERRIIDLAEFKEKIGEVAEEEFDLVINPNHDTDIYMDCLTVAALNAEIKVGFKQDSHRVNEMPSNNYYNMLLPREPMEHVAEYGIQILNALGFAESDYRDCNYFHSKSDTKLASDLIAKFKLDSAPLIGIHRAGSSAMRSMSMEQVRSVYTHLESNGFNAILIEDVDDRRLLTTRGLKLGAVSALMSHMTAVIAPCSAMKNMASANDINLVEVTHVPSDLEHLNGPYLDGGAYRWTAGKYWAPRRRNAQHVVIRPDPGRFDEAQVDNGTAIRSIQPAAIAELVSSL